MASELHNLSAHDSSKVPSGAGKRVVVVVSEWNEEITSSLLSGAYDTLVQYGVLPNDIAIMHVPGSFELPLGAQRAIGNSYRNNTRAGYYSDIPAPHSVICLGCVIQGETPHFTFICDAVANGIMKLMLKTRIPVIFGVLTTNTLEQAQDRSGGKHGNKGMEAAITSLKMMDWEVIKSITKPRPKHYAKQIA